jgi:DNA-binding transcriptional ArsR family regulator
MESRTSARTLLTARPQHVEAFAALAHQTRLELFFLLVRRGAEITAGELQEALEIPAPTLSHHLNTLRRAGLIDSRKEERYVYYSVKPDTVSELVRLLTACC